MPPDCRLPSLMSLSNICAFCWRISAYRDEDRPLIHALMRERKTRAVKRSVKVLVLGDDGELAQTRGRPVTEEA